MGARGMSRRQIPGPYPPVSPYAPTPAEGVPAQPALWRVVAVYRGPRKDIWDEIEDGDSPTALTPEAAAEAWARQWGAFSASAREVRARSDDGTVIELDVEITYRATRRAVLP